MRSDARGFTLVETMVAAAIGLVVAGACYQMLVAARRTFTRQSDVAEMQSAGRATLDFLAADLRSAGYHPFGPAIVAIPNGTATRVRRLSDLTGNGTTTDSDDDVTYLFQDPDGDGRYDVLRGLDRNGDGDFADAGESAETILRNVVPIDLNGDAIPEPFLAYDRAPPDALQITIAFGVRTRRSSELGGRAVIVPFRGTAVVRNRVPAS